MKPLGEAQQIGVWDRRMADIAKYSPEPDAMLVELVEGLNLKPSRALDSGCGPGRHLVWLAANGWQATGIDWSEHAIADARRELSTRGLSAELVKCDLLDPPDLGPPFRLAIATRVFHHGNLEHFHTALHSLRPLLAADGCAVISLPSRNLVPLTLAGEWTEPGTFIPAEGDETGIPHHFFTPTEVRDAALEFASVEVHTVPEEYEEQTADGPRLIRREWLWVVLGA